MIWDSHFYIDENGLPKWFLTDPFEKQMDQIHVSPNFEIEIDGLFHKKIQSAIDNWTPGKIIIVHPGIYNEQLTITTATVMYFMHNVTLKSLKPTASDEAVVRILGDSRISGNLVIDLTDNNGVNIGILVTLDSAPRIEIDSIIGPGTSILLSGLDHVEAKRRIYIEAKNLNQFILNHDVISSYGDVRFICDYVANLTLSSAVDAVFDANVGKVAQLVISDSRNRLESNITAKRIDHVTAISGHTTINDSVIRNSGSENTIDVEQTALLRLKQCFVQNLDNTKYPIKQG
jgi:hypothetical protein